MDNSGVGRSAEALNDGQANAAEQLPNNFESANSETLASGESMNAVDVRANNNSETQRRRNELQELFAQRSEKSDSAPQSNIGEAEETKVSPELEKLNSIKISEGSKSMPSAYAAEAQSLMDKSLKEGPAEAIEMITQIRENYRNKMSGNA